MSQKFNYKQWLLIGLLLRLAVMPISMHGDMFFVYDYPHYFSLGIWDAYTAGFEKIQVGYYPPFAMIFFAACIKFLSAVSPGYGDFLHSIFLENLAPLESPRLFLGLFLMKVPYLFVEFLLIKVCFQLASDDLNRRHFAIFWAVNPVVIYGTYMVGHLDLIPAFFVMLAFFYCLQPGKGPQACLSLSAGCLFKVFPIVFLPMVLLICGRNLRDYFFLSLYGILPVVLFFGLFYWISGESVFYVYGALSAHDMSVSTDYGSLALRVFQAGVYSLVCWHIFRNRSLNGNAALLAQYFLVVYLAVYLGHIFAATHRYIWSIPFWILLLQHKPTWRKPFYFLLALIFLAGLRSRTQALGIFAPIHPELFLSVPSVKDVMGYIFGVQNYLLGVKVFLRLFLGGIILILIKNLYYPPKKTGT